MKKKAVQPTPSFLQELEDSFYYAEVDSASKSFRQVDAVQSAKKAASNAPKKANRLASFSELPRVDSSMSDLGSSMYDLNIPLSPLSSVQSSQQSTIRPVDSKSTADFLQTSFPTTGPSSHSQSFLAYQARQQAAVDSEDSVIAQLRGVDCHALDAELGLDKVLQLLDMGFALNQICTALRACSGDVQTAILHCLEHADSHATVDLGSVAGGNDFDIIPASVAEVKRDVCWVPPPPVSSKLNQIAPVVQVELDVLLDDDVVAAAQSAHNLHHLVESEESPKVLVPSPQTAVGTLMGAVAPGRDQGVMFSQAEQLPIGGDLGQSELLVDSAAAPSLPPAEEEAAVPAAVIAAPPAPQQPDGFGAPALVSTWPGHDQQPGHTAEGAAADYALLDNGEHRNTADDDLIGASADSALPDDSQQSGHSEEDGPAADSALPNNQQQLRDDYEGSASVVVAHSVLPDDDSQLRPMPPRASEDPDLLAVSVTGYDGEQAGDDVAAAVAVADSVLDDPLVPAVSPAVLAEASLGVVPVSPARQPGNLSMAASLTVLPAEVTAGAQICDVEPQNALERASLGGSLLMDEAVDSAGQSFGNNIHLSDSDAEVGSLASSNGARFVQGSQSYVVGDELETEQTSRNSPASDEHVVVPSSSSSFSVAQSSATERVESESGMAPTANPNNAIEERGHPTSALSGPGPVVPPASQQPAAPPFNLAERAASVLVRRGEVPLVNRRAHLPYSIERVTASTGSTKWRGTLSLRQPHLSAKEASPQGSRPDQLALSVCPTREVCEDLCVSAAPPLWRPKQVSSTCVLCRTGFSMFRKPHHCRNCGHIVCPDCSDRLWPAGMLPSTYHDQEKIVRVCYACHLFLEHFVLALKRGDLDETLTLYSSGNVNLHQPLTVYQHWAYPVHLACSGGSLPLLQWLLEVKHCSLMDRVSGKPLTTASGLTALAVAAYQGHAEIMHYLIHSRGCSVAEISEVDVLQRALHAAMRARGPLPSPPLPKGVPPRLVTDDVVFASPTPSLSPSPDKPTLGLSLGKHAKPRPLPASAIQVVNTFVRAQRVIQLSIFVEGEQQQHSSIQPGGGPVPSQTTPVSNLSPNPNSRSNPSPSLEVIRASVREGSRPNVTPLVASQNVSPTSTTSSSRVSTSFLDPPSPSVVSVPTYSSRPMHMQRVVSIAMSAAVRAEVLGSGLAYSSDADVPVETSAFLPEDLIFTVAPPPRNPSS